MGLAKRLHGVIPVGDKGGLETLVSSMMPSIRRGAVVIDDRTRPFMGLIVPWKQRRGQ
jgi:hypothetical protein